MSDTETTFEGWAILELMGHRRLAGYVRPVEYAGTGLIRLDVPGYLHTEPTGEQEERGAATQFYSPSALYCLTPTTEAIARRVSEARRPEPVTTWELPPAAVDRLPEEAESADDYEQHPL
jgi:hypothetical protein